MNPYITTQNRTEAVPACAGQWDLFDSVTLADHKRAKALCTTCPVRLRCHTDFLDVKSASHPQGGPAGTWAGVLYNREGEPSAGSGVHRAEKCRRGHIYTPDTTHVDHRGYRTCKVCRVERKEQAA